MVMLIHTIMISNAMNVRPVTDKKWLICAAPDPGVVRYPGSVVVDPGVSVRSWQPQ